MTNKSTFTTSFWKNISMMGAASFLAIGAATAQPVLNVPFELSQDKLAAQGQGAVAVELPGAHMHSITGVVGGAVAFDGIKNQQIQINNDPLFALQKEMTISAWVKPTAFDRTNYQTVVSRGWNWELRTRYQGSIEVRWLGPNDKNNTILRSPQEIPIGEWTHIAYTYSLSAHTAALYVNGEIKEKKSNVSFPLWDMEQKPLLVGMSPGNSNLFHGAVDELKIYDRALSFDEVKQLYSQEGKSVFRDKAIKMDAQLDSLQSRVESKSEKALNETYQNARAAVAALKEQVDVASYIAASVKINDLTDALYYSDIAQQAGKQGITNAILFITPPFSDRPILPKTQITAAETGREIDLQGSPSELLTSSFVIRPTKENAKGLLVTATDLKSAEGATIPASEIDIRIVKAWYQAGSAWNGLMFDHKQGADTLRPVLVPELLLHDESLVKVDYEHKSNYLKLKDASGSRYVNISERKQAEITDQEYKSTFINTPAERFPVADDAATLQPLDIPCNDNQQFWLNVKLPQNSTPGMYHGKLLVKSTSGVKGEIDLAVRVLPITLSKPKTHYDPNQPFYMSVYYRGKLSPDGKAYIGSEYRSRTQFEAEMRNLRDHGIDFVSNASPLTEPENLNLSLAIQQKYLGGNILFNTGTGYNLGAKLDDSPESLKAMNERAAQLKEIAKKHGYDTIYTYGVDELEAEAVAKEKRIWEELRKSGIKVYVSGMRRDIPERFGDVLDLLVMLGTPNQSIAQLMHQHGHHVFSYGNPQSGPENPKPFRTNYGIQLWKRNYDSSMTYEYQSAFGTPWNDFDSRTSPYRNHNFTYPTVNGTIDTIAWEGYAQAYKDVKYVSKLAELIRQWKDSDDATKKQIANVADKYIDELDITAETDLDEVRHQIIEYILQLQ